MEENRFRLLLDGLEGARKGLAGYALLVAVLTAASFSFSEEALVHLTRLLGRKVVAYDPSEGLLALLALSLYLGLLLSFPAGCWMLWAGVIAPRTGWSKARGGWVILVATALFLAGMLLGWFVLLPAGIGFLTGFERPDIRAYLSVRRFVTFCGTMTLALGVCFQAPLVSWFLARAGWLSTRFFRTKWRHAVLGCVVLAAVITPTPDVYNLGLMSLPLVGLFFVSYGVVWAGSAGRRKGAGRTEG